MSEAYNHKKKVRDLRELERDLHNHAIQVYKDYYSENAGMCSSASKIYVGLEQSDVKPQSNLDELTIQHNSVSIVSDKPNSISKG